MKDNLFEYCEEFFNELEIYNDINNGETNKKDFIHAIRGFVNSTDNDNENEKAIEIYEVFSRAYWMIKNDDSILAMVKEMKFFEERAGVLTEKQRDHFVHSVNVFLLGLAIYIRMPNYRKSFEKYITFGNEYNDYYKTKHEEFLYRWGIASLFHDIAYPIEISLKQLTSYLTFVSEKCGLDNNILKASVTIKNSEAFNLLPKMNPKKEFDNEFFLKYPKFKENATNSLSLMALELSQSFGIDFSEIEKAMYGYIEKMSSNNHIDHGYYSALIVLRWFYKLVDKHEWNPSYFYYPILSSVTSIILHNYYKFGLMNLPFNMQRFDMKNHPLGFLLILCDELQDWGRTPYGVKDLKKVFPNKKNIEIYNNELTFEYLYVTPDWDGKLFAESKLETINKVLQVDSLFNKFIII